MNISPSTSTRLPENVLPDAEQPAIQMSEHRLSIKNSCNSLSSFAKELEQTFPKEILLEILRRMHPTRQVGHPWQYLLPEPYAQLLQHSASMTSVENTHTLLEMLSVIPPQWLHDAINAIGENFIKRTDNFNSFITVINFILSGSKLNSHALASFTYGLIDVMGKITSSDIIHQAIQESLPANLVNTEVNINHEEKNIQFEMRLQKAQNQLFFHKVWRILWDIKHASIKDEPPESAALKKRLIKSFVVLEKRYSNTLLKINQEREAFHAIPQDSANSQKMTHYAYQSINEKIKTFNDNRCHHVNLVNRHTLEILWNFITRDTIELPNNTLEKIQLKLAGAIGMLHKQQRHVALYTILQSKKCSVPVLTALTYTVNAQFYQHPYDAMRLIADEMETQHKNNQDVSPVIGAIKSLCKNEPVSIWSEYAGSLSDYCQQLLRDAPSNG